FRPIVRGERDLLADDRREVVVERQYVRFDLPALEIALGRIERESPRVEGLAAGTRRHEAELRARHESKHVVHGAVVQDSEVAYLIAHEAVWRVRVIGWKERPLRHSEHTNFLIHVAQLRNL